MLDAVIGLGSNLGDRRALLVAAAEALRAVGTVVARSAIYETEPLGPPQPRYLNAAVRLLTVLEPPGLLAALIGVEQSLGRVRAERWGPRCIDLDVLWIAGITFSSAELFVPHPGLRDRAFALLPLLDVAPEAEDPRDGTLLRHALERLDASSVLEIRGTRDRW